MDSINLFTPGQIDGFHTPNRIVMAPMTRSRATSEGMPSALAIEYYQQRASAGLIITEGTAPSASGSGYPRTPSLYSKEQAAAWRKITDAVHAKGGRIFVQFMHVGRIAHSANRVISDAPVAPSAIRAAGQMWTDALGMQDFDMPRALDGVEVPGVVQEYAQATRLAIEEAGFDGVELHAASGYLPMQFLSLAATTAPTSTAAAFKIGLASYWSVWRLWGKLPAPPRNWELKSAPLCLSTTYKTTIPPKRTPPWPRQSPRSAWPICTSCVLREFGTGSPRYAPCSKEPCLPEVVSIRRPRAKRCLLHERTSSFSENPSSLIQICRPDSPLVHRSLNRTKPLSTRLARKERRLRTARSSLINVWGNSPFLCRNGTARIFTDS